MFQARAGALGRCLGSAADRCWDKLSRPSAGGGAVRLHDEIGDEIAAIFARQQRECSITLQRDIPYLRWRFMKRPGTEHFVITLSEGGVMRAAAVFKLEPIFGNPVLVLMDFARLPGCDGSLLDLLRKMRSEGEMLLAKKFHLILASGCSGFFAHLRKAGFIRVPHFADPRPLNLLAWDISGKHGEVIAAPVNWHVVLSDWDVF